MPTPSLMEDSKVQQMSEVSSARNSDKLYMKFFLTELYACTSESLPYLCDDADHKLLCASGETSNLNK